MCKCRKKIVLTTSWTDENPGRRFETCVDYGKRFSCGHWNWYDDEMCPRSKQVIPGLLRRLNGRDETIQELRDVNTELLAENEELKAKIVVLEGGIGDESDLVDGEPEPLPEDDEDDESIHLQLDELHVKLVELQNRQTNEKRLEAELEKMKVRATRLGVVLSFAVVMYVWHMMGLIYGVVILG